MYTSYQEVMSKILLIPASRPRLNLTVLLEQIAGGTEGYTDVTAVVLSKRVWQWLVSSTARMRLIDPTGSQQALDGWVGTVAGTKTCIFTDAFESPENQTLLDELTLVLRHYALTNAFSVDAFEVHMPDQNIPVHHPTAAPTNHRGNHMIHLTKPKQSSHTSRFVNCLFRFNSMYRMPVNYVPTIEVGVPINQRLRDLKVILQKELNEIDSIIEKADLHVKGAPFVVAGDGQVMPATPLITSVAQDNQALLMDNRLDILTDVADLMCDLQVYCGSEQVKWGIPQDEVLDIIMDSNFSKMGADGKPLYDSNGKLQKGPNYYKPEPAIKALLKNLIESYEAQTAADAAVSSPTAA